MAPAAWAPSAFGALANPAAPLVLLAAWIALALWFNAAPEIDIAVSRVFFDPSCTATGTECPRFPLSQYWLPMWFRKAMHNLPALLAIAMLVVLAVEFAFGHTLSNAWTRARAALTSTSGAATTIFPGLPSGAAAWMTFLPLPVWNSPSPSRPSPSRR